ncbi:MAG: usg protein [Alphaproteobacteria bacterium]
MTTAFRKQLEDFRLTTAEILYHMPDHPALLQTYVWQDLDRAPQFPELTRFLEFWQARLDGKLHSVKIASRSVIAPPQFRLAGIAVTLH